MSVGVKDSRMQVTSSKGLIKAVKRVYKYMCVNISILYGNSYEIVRETVITMIYSKEKIYTMINLKGKHYDCEGKH